MVRARLAALVYALGYAAEEMGAVLARTAVSPNIRDRRDYSCAILDPEGRLVAQAEHIPVHLGTMAATGPRLVEEVERRYGVEPGTVYATNNPYLAGTHLNDLLLLAPIHHGGRLVAWAAVKAHHVDVGGRAPGSIGAAETIHDEGVLLDPVPLARGGRVEAEALRPLLEASREPLLLEMDLHAQLAAVERGRRLLRDLAARKGAERLLEAMDWAIGHGERYARSLAEKLPEGRVATAVDHVEGAERDYVIQVRLAAQGDRITVDFTGTSPQAAEPLNATAPTTAAAVAYTLKMVLDPATPVNHGFYMAVELRLPGASLVSATYPAPVSAYTETAQRIVDTLQAALAELLPGRVPAASCGTMSNIAIGGRGWAFYETIGCGQGAKPRGDGADAVHVNMTNTMNTPVEILEQTIPVRITRYSLRPGSAGLGAHRGGLGIIREYLALEEATVSIAGNRVRHRPWGLQGGEPAAPARYLLVTREGRVVELPPLAAVKLRPGDRLRVETPGGGGYGDPCSRPRELIESDVEEGKLTADQAAWLRQRCTVQGGWPPSRRGSSS